MVEELEPLLEPPLTEVFLDLWNMLPDNMHSLSPPDDPLAVQDLCPLEPSEPPPPGSPPVPSPPRRLPPSPPGRPRPPWCRPPRTTGATTTSSWASWRPAPPSPSPAPTRRC